MTLAAQNNGRTTRLGGITGAGFLPGESGNPGGRPKGLSRRVRELVGDDGEAIAVYMLSVMRDENSRTADRLEAAKWLADRGFGRSVQTLDVDITAHPAIDVTTISTEDLEAMLAILEKYEPDAAELAVAGELEIGSSAITPSLKAGLPRHRWRGQAPLQVPGAPPTGPRTGPHRACSAWLRETLLAFKTGRVW